MHPRGSGSSAPTVHSSKSGTSFSLQISTRVHSWFLVLHTFQVGGCGVHKRREP
ncbi:hypothetical protein DsansV1_C26g0190341 [Dioscorea sansibarensis]